MQAENDGYTKAQGYAASLRQMVAENYVDFDELEDCADFIEWLAKMLEGAAKIFEQALEGGE